jgi:hypothetical protein
LSGTTEEYRAEKSVLRNLGPIQLALVKELCTIKDSVHGEYTQTIQRFTQEISYQGGEADDKKIRDGSNSSQS